MNASTAKTARFKEIVARAGVPESYTPWTNPKRDRHFQKAWRENRVLSVHQTVSGSKKDVAEIGYAAGGKMLYLIFPHSLEAFAGRKVVGIDYNLLPAPAIARRTKRTQVHDSRPKAEKPVPKPKRFAVTVKITASMVVTETVEADSARAASASILKGLDARTVDFSDAKIARRVTKTKQL